MAQAAARAAHRRAARPPEIARAKWRPAGLCRRAGNIRMRSIAAAENLITKFADTDFKEIALYIEADAYQQKGDPDKAQIYAERALEANPKNFQARCSCWPI